MERTATAAVRPTGFLKPKPMMGQVDRRNTIAAAPPAGKKVLNVNEDSRTGPINASYTQAGPRYLWSTTSSRLRSSSSKNLCAEITQRRQSVAKPLPTKSAARKSVLIGSNNIKNEVKPIKKLIAKVHPQVKNHAEKSKGLSGSKLSEQTCTNSKPPALKVRGQSTAEIKFTISKPTTDELPDERFWCNYGGFKTPYPLVLNVIMNSPNDIPEDRPQSPTFLDLDNPYPEYRDQWLAAEQAAKAAKKTPASEPVISKTEFGPYREVQLIPSTGPSIALLEDSEKSTGDLSQFDSSWDETATPGTGFAHPNPLKTLCSKFNRLDMNTEQPQVKAVPLAEGLENEMGDHVSVLNGGQEDYSIYETPAGKNPDTEMKNESTCSATPPAYLSFEDHDDKEFSKTQ